MGSYGINRDVESWQTTSLNGSTITNGSESATGAIALDGYLGVEVSVEVAYGGTASAGVQVHILGDIDGTNYEARADLPHGFEMPKTTSTTFRRRFKVSAQDYANFKVNVYNPSGASVTVTVRYRRFLGETA